MVTDNRELEWSMMECIFRLYLELISQTPLVGGFTEEQCCKYLDDTFKKFKKDYMRKHKSIIQLGLSKSDKKLYDKGGN